MAFFPQLKCNVQSGWVSAVDNKGTTQSFVAFAKLWCLSTLNLLFYFTVISSSTFFFFKLQFSSNDTSCYSKSVQSGQLIQCLQAVPNCHCQKEEVCSQHWRPKLQSFLTAADEPYEQNCSFLGGLTFAVHLYSPAPSWSAGGAAPGGLRHSS